MAAGSNPAGCTTKPQIRLGASFHLRGAIALTGPRWDQLPTHSPSPPVPPAPPDVPHHQPDRPLSRLPCHLRRHSAGRIQHHLRQPPCYAGVSGGDPGTRCSLQQTRYKTVLTANLAADLDIWLRMLTLHNRDDLSEAEPESMRFRRYHLPARLVSHARRRVLGLERTWPWAGAFTSCWQRLGVLPAPT